MSDAAERFRRTERLFDACERLSQAERDALLSRECGDDRWLRREVEELLELAPRADRFLAEPPAVPDFESAAGLAGELPLAPTVDRWSVVRPLGRGGMGVVYLVERTEGDYRQLGALKVVASTRPGPDIIERFHRERRVLARIEHPHVARLLDGGVTAEGLPYLVMEWVDGVAIDAFCTSGDLGVRSRVRLYLDVCAAVAEAHRRLVIHRDLKPSNVLVTRDGQVKLLDFGVSKVLDPDLDGPSITLTHDRRMTPAYASPEQIRGEPVTTASDVFSLGVMLFELLTGARPHGDRTSSVFDLERAILERDPLPPSRLAPGIDRDLDAVILAALRKDPDRRYLSVEAFAVDLRRCLERLPVSVRRDNWLDLTMRFAARKPALAAALAGIVVTSAAGAGIGFMFATRAANQATLARAAEASADRRLGEARALSRSMLSDVYDSLVKMPASTAARKTLVDATLRFLDGLAADQGDDEEVLNEVAEGYRRAISVLGRTGVGFTGALEEALSVCDRQAAVVARLRRIAPNAGTTLRVAARAIGDRSDVLISMGLADDALSAANDAITAAESWSAQVPGDREAPAVAAKAYERRAAARLRKGDLDGCAADLNTAIGRLEELLSGEPDHPVLLHNQRVDLSNLVGVLLQRDDVHGAVEAARRAVLVAARVVDLDPVSAPYRAGLASARLRMGEAALVAGDEAEGLTALAAARAAFATMAAEDPDNVVFRERMLYASAKRGEHLLEQQDLEAASTALDVALDDAERLYAMAPTYLEARRGITVMLDRCARLALLRGQAERAVAHCDRALALIAASRETAGDDAQSRATRLGLLTRRAEALTALHHADARDAHRSAYEEAVAHYEQAEDPTWGGEEALAAIEGAGIFLEGEAARGVGAQRADREAARAVFEKGAEIAEQLALTRGSFAATAQRLRSASARLGAEVLDPPALPKTEGA